MHLQLLALVLATLATSLLWQKVCETLDNDASMEKRKQLTLVDVGENTTLSNCDTTQQLVQLLIVSDGELEMTGNDTGLLVVTGSVASEFENFSGKVLKDGSEVDGSTGTNTLSIVALAEKTVHTTDREGETSLRRTAKENVSQAVLLMKWPLPVYLRLSALGARGLATRLATSHFD